MIEIIEKYNGIINDFIWGVPLIVLLLGTGVYFTIRLGFFQITKIKLIWKNIKDKIFVKKKDRKKGEIPSFQASLVSLGEIVGSGNIAGVATAIAAAGPGALVWMWIAAFFGMATKYAEIALGILFRKQDKDETYSAGPM